MQLFSQACFKLFDCISYDLILYQVNVYDFHKNSKSAGLDHKNSNCADDTTPNECDQNYGKFINLEFAINKMFNWLKYKNLKVRCN